MERYCIEEMQKNIFAINNWEVFIIKISNNFINGAQPGDYTNILVVNNYLYNNSEMVVQNLFIYSRASNPN